MRGQMRGQMSTELWWVDVSHPTKKFKGDKNAQFHDILTDCMSTPIFAIYENSFDLTLTISSALVTDGNRSYSFAVDIEVVMHAA